MSIFSGDDNRGKHIQLQISIFTLVAPVPLSCGHDVRSAQLTLIW